MEETYFDGVIVGDKWYKPFGFNDEDGFYTLTVIREGVCILNKVRLFIGMGFRTVGIPRIIEGTFLYQTVIT